MKAILTFLIAVSALAVSAFGEYKSTVIEKIPGIKQKPDFCGEACIEMVLRKLGKNYTQDDVFNLSGVDPAEGRGCYTADMKNVMKKLGFEPGNTWYKIPAGSDAGLEAQWKALHEDLLQGIPSIVCMHYNDSSNTTEHFRLITGYDSKTDEVIYNEPAKENGAYMRMKRDMFLKLWPLKYSQEWQIIRLALKADKIEDVKTSKGFTNADFCQKVIKLKKDLPKKGTFTIVVQPPFIVIGDESRENVKRSAEKTVKWAVDMMKKDFFDKDPAEIISIWLFKDADSYNDNCFEIFGQMPTTPYGFYSSANDALIMNIGTGGGTLVHEIVHPFIRANFPECPSWLNEGLGSLYEQSGERNGHIIGLTNWRLAGLKKEIKEKGLPSFEDLLDMTSDEFYRSDKGNNYAQARYLCYYLQEKDLLVEFYKEFFNNQKKDPTGLNSLKKVLGEKGDLTEFKKNWEAYCMKLTFP